MNPVFSTDGKYLFYLTNRSLTATYSDLGDGTWIYPNSTQIASLSLTKEAPSLLTPKNDEIKKEEQEDKKEKTAEKRETEDKKPPEAATATSVEVDFDNIEARLVILPPQAGNIGALIPFEGKLVYLRQPNTGSGERSSSLIYYDLEKREEKTIISDINRVKATADGKSLLVSSMGKYGIIKPAPNQKIEKAIPTSDLMMDLVPRQEWRQIFLDTWRRHRDFFYDPEMHQVDWEEMRDRYGALLEDARTRWDISFIQSNLAAELSAGHTYTFGGDVEKLPADKPDFWVLTGKWIIIGIGSNGS